MKKLLFTILGFLTGLFILYFLFIKTGYTVESWFCEVLMGDNHWEDWLIYIIFIFIIFIIPSLVGYAVSESSDDIPQTIIGIIFTPLLSIILVAISLVIFAFSFAIIMNWENVFGPLTLVLIVGAFASVFYTNYIIIDVFIKTK